MQNIPNIYRVDSGQRTSLLTAGIHTLKCISKGTEVSVHSHRYLYAENAHLAPLYIN